MGQQPVNKWRAELFGEDVHQDAVILLAGDDPGLPPPPDLLEADIAVAGNRPLVELKDTEHHAVQVEQVEGMIKQQLERIRAVSAPPVALVANDNPDLGSAVDLTDVEEQTAPNQRVSLQVDDGEGRTACSGHLSDVLPLPLQRLQDIGFIPERKSHFQVIEPDAPLESVLGGDWRKIAFLSNQATMVCQDVYPLFAFYLPPAYPIRPAQAVPRTDPKELSTDLPRLSGNERIEKAGPTAAGPATLSSAKP